MTLLSALLTQDQVVSPKAIDEAISCQAINGGDFETNLLEVGAIGEDTLARYVAAVHGLPHATREDVSSADPVAIARLPRALAERHRMVPLVVAGGRFVVAVAGSVPPAVRREVEATVGLPLEPRCVTTVRLAWALWRYYQVPLSERFQRLCARLSVAPPGPVPAEVIVPLVHPRGGTRPSTPVLDALAALDAMIRDEEDDASSPTPSEPAPPPGLRRSLSAQQGEAGGGGSVVRPMAVNLPTSTPPMGLPLLGAVAELRASSPAVDPSGAEALGAPSRDGTVAEVRGTSPAVDPSGAEALEAPSRDRDETIDPPPATRPALPVSMVPTVATGARADASLQAFQASVSSPASPSMAQSLGVSHAEAEALREPRSLVSLPPPAIEVFLEGGDGLLRDVRLSLLPPPPRGIPLEEALRRIEGAHDRDTVVDAMLAHVHERFAYAALFVVQGGRCTGLAAVGEGTLSDAVRRVSFSLERASTFRLAFDSGAVEVARVEPGTLDAELCGQLQRTGVEEVVVVPLRIGARVALLLWADDGRRAPTALAVRELDAFVKRCSTAFERIIAERKRPNRGSSPQITVAAARPVERPSLPNRAARLQALRAALAADVPAATSTSPSSRDDDRPVGVGDEAPREEAALGLKATPVRAPGALCDAVVSDLLDGRMTVSDALETLLAHGDTGLEAVFRRFPGPWPGPLREGMARSALLEEAPLLRVVVAFRQAALSRLQAALDHDDSAVRQAALVCLAECVHPSSIGLLTARLFDDDAAVRTAALEALGTHQHFPEFDAVYQTLRASLSDPRTAVRREAIVALGALRDAVSVPALVAALGDADGTVVDAAHRALTVITRQDFGPMAAPWVSWWAHAGRLHRVQWLIDALLHPEPGIRHDASEELKRLTGQYFGYYFNLPKRERERAHQRYLDWWKREGARRFGVPEG
jgi:hypothetical protein